MADAPSVFTRTKSKAENKDPVQIVVDANKAALRSMGPQIATWRSAIDAFQNKGLVQDPHRVNVKVGRLIADTETVIPRDVSALLGTRPYMPIRAAVDSESTRAECMVDLCDHFTDRRFFVKFADAMRICRTLGISYIEPRWKYWPVSVMKRETEKDEFGRIVGMRELRTYTVKDGLEWLVHNPEAVRPHPFGNDLHVKPWIVIAETVPVAEIERLIEDPYHPYELKGGVKPRDLRSSAPVDADSAADLRRERDQFHESIREDIGVLLRYYANPTPGYPNGRWIHVWNFKYCLMDVENMSPNMPLTQKPVAAIRNISHIGPDRYWPIGMYEYTRDLAEWNDKLLSLYIDSTLMNSAQLIAYNPDRVNREDLIAQPGQRIPVEGGEFDRAIYPIKVGQPPHELLELSESISDKIDTRIGLFDYQRGSSPIRKETATASDLLANAGNTRLEFGVLSIEQTGLADTAYLTYKEQDANLTDGTKNEILGPEKAYLLGSADPDSLAGGFAWNFQGSDRVMRKAQKAENEIQMYNMMRNQDTILEPWIMDRQMMENSEVYTREQLDKMGLTEEAQQQARMAAQEAAMQQQMAGVPPEGGEQAPPVSESTAVQNPNTISTPATNLATNTGA